MSWWRRRTTPRIVEHVAGVHDQQMWREVGLAMQVVPPREVDGELWLNGHDDGVYMVQCHLNGMALGSDDDAERLRLFELRVALNRIRHDGGDPSSRKPVQ